MRMCAFHLAALLAAPSALAAPPAGRLAFTPPASPPDAGVPLEASRVAEARALVPPLLRYGALRPEPGRWVEYAVRQPGGETHVERLSCTGVTETARGPLYQLELEVHIQPHVQVVAWVVGGPSLELDRVAVSVNSGDAVSVPVDLPLAHPALRGEPRGGGLSAPAPAPFGGATRLESWDEPAPVGRVTARRAASVPLIGLYALKHGGMEWTATGSGTGATPQLRSQPLVIPRTVPLPDGK